MSNFEWNEVKNQTNQAKHGVSFNEAQYAFADSQMMILEDERHSTPTEKRYFCIGKVEEGILTVRFTYRASKIRIFGAGYWTKYRKLYMQQEAK